MIIIKNPINTGYVRALDGLRAIAIVAVVGFHGGWLGFSLGGFGVDLFFVLSGFLITSLLLREKNTLGKISIRNFYYRRALRIIPAYVVFLFLYGLLCLLVFKDFIPNLAKSTLVASTFTTNIFFSWFDDNILQAHTWSLSLEEQFYLLFPLIILRLPNLLVIKLCIFLLIFAPLWRAFIFFNFDDDNLYRIGYGPDTRYDSILWGCFLSLIYTEEKFRVYLGKFKNHNFLLAGLFILTLSFSVSIKSLLFKITIGYSGVAIGFCLVLFYILNNKNTLLNKFLSWNPIRFLGVISYSLYLWHPSMLGLANRIQNYINPIYSGIVEQVSYVLLSLVVATVSYFFIEQPFLKLKK